jgi:hypothetical protein
MGDAHYLLLHAADFQAARAASPAQRAAAEESCVLLLKAGADAVAVDGCGRTALEWHLSEDSARPSDAPGMASPALLRLLWPAAAARLQPCREVPLGRALELAALPRARLLEQLLAAVAAAGADRQKLLGCVRRSGCLLGLSVCRCEGGGIRMPLSEEAIGRRQDAHTPHLLLV